ncbi:MAG: hypothetical protein PVF39_13340, partial [Desulfobacterales bacterium]
IKKVNAVTASTTRTSRPIFFPKNPIDGPEYLKTWIFPHDIRAQSRMWTNFSALTAFNDMNFSSQ